MTKVAFFGHDSGDAAVRRRVRAMCDGDVTVVGFMMRRQNKAPPEWENIDLPGEAPCEAGHSSDL